MNRKVSRFLGPRQVELLEEPLLAPGPHEVMVRTELTAVSAGTEMLVYRGELPEGGALAVDAVSERLSYPTAYGYCAVGVVSNTGTGVDKSWLGKRVFAFQPHASHFVATTDSLLIVPEDMDAAQAVFLPNTETAVNLVQDAAPLLGERAIVMGQGVLGLLTASLLHEFPLSCLVTADKFHNRRLASEAIGVSACLDPEPADFLETARSLTGEQHPGFDFTVELTGDPSALNQAIALTRFSGRVIIGSWFGRRTAPLDLGGDFHRSRIRIVASQVSTIAPELTGRWDKARRFSEAWRAIARIQPERWITHRFPIDRAAEAYDLLDRSPQEALQVVFEYP